MNDFIFNIEQTYQTLIDNIKGFKARENQRQMILKIAETLNQGYQKYLASNNLQQNTEINNNHQSNCNITMIEAATGIGKSIAYLIALTSHCQYLKQQGIKNKKIVIATATKVLQNQLFAKDLPIFIKNTSNYQFKIGLAKGRNSYLCPYKLKNIMEAQDFNKSDKNSKQIQYIHNLFYQQCWSGDVDELPKHKQLIGHITIQAHECLHNKCQFNQKGHVVCPYYNNKEYLRQCDIIITNHSLLLTHMKAPEDSNILPISWQNTILCIDEAHNFNNYALANFTDQFNLQHNINMLDVLASLIYDNKKNTSINADANYCQEINRYINQLIAHFKTIEFAIQQQQNTSNNQIIILNDYIETNQILPSCLNDFAQAHILAIKILSGLQKIESQLQEIVNNDSYIMQLNFYTNLLETIANTIGYIINIDDSSNNANARWIEINENNQFIIHAGLTHIGNILSEKLWSKVYASCLVSASLSINNSFKYMLSLLGLPQSTPVTKLASHFNYQQQARLLIADFIHSPDYLSINKFNQELSEFLTKQLNYTQAFGTLVIFFNRQQMLTVYNKLPVSIQDKVILQTDYKGLQNLLTHHQKQIDANCPSIIFGMNALSEGVDLISRYCMHVIITKIPFELPKNPFNIVKEYWIKQEGNNFFMNIALPEAGLKLLQTTGRLIRTETDQGQITICDNRVNTKFYGKILLAQLSHFPNKTADENFLAKAFID